MAQSRDMDAPIIREPGSYQVYILSLGNRRELVLPFLRDWIGIYKTLAAVQYKVEQDIALLQPTLYGLAKKTAEAITLRLVGWGAVAAAYHADDEQKPRYDHNHFGVVLLEVGQDRRAVNSAVCDILSISTLDATTLIDSAPMPILENVSVDDAVAVHKRLSKAGAKCELTGYEPIWMKYATDHIPRDPGPYLLIMQRIGLQTLMVSKTVGTLLPQLNEDELEAMLNEAPVVLLRDISLETAELVKIKLEQFGATISIQETAERHTLGASIHPQNPAFGMGEYRIVLDGISQFKKISVIQELRKLLPGVYLTEITAFFEDMPAVVIDGVDHDTASSIRERLEAAGALVEVHDR